MVETKEKRSERLKNRKRVFAELNRRHKKSLDLIQKEDWAGVRKHDEKCESEALI